MQAPQAPDRVAPAPIASDDAMGARQWKPTPAVYPSFSSETGPSEVVLVPDDRLAPPAHAAVETPLFVADLVLMPVAMIFDPPWEQVEGSSFYLLPTYSGNPPSTPPPGRPTDLSGGPGNAYNPAPGRAVNPPEAPAE